MSGKMTTPFKIMLGVECVAVFPSVTRFIRFYGVRARNRFIGLAIGGEEIEVSAEKLTAALRSARAARAALQAKDA